ncbi:MAG: hypothetical protein M1820_005034 [Bogoriella megaspora]|nr:MAG: hypothetical protein M1820_005034 [Bogoriella megaspora]
MAEPLSIAAGVAGLLSLAIQVTNGLQDYCRAYRGQDASISRVYSKLDGLRTALHTIEQAIGSRRFQMAESQIKQQIESTIFNCQIFIDELEIRLLHIKSCTAPQAKGGLMKAGYNHVAFPLQQKSLRRLEEDANDFRAQLTFAMDILCGNDVQQASQHIDDIRNVLQMVRAAQLSEKIRLWLNAPDPTSNHTDACNKKHPSTGRWFVEDAVYTRWLRGQSWLWLSGFAGCGKTVLCSTAVNHVLRHKASTQKTIGVCFFYFTFTDQSKQDLSSMLRAIISQLSHQASNNYADLERLYSSMQPTSPGVFDLFNLFQTLVGRFEDVYLFVDAVDESPLKHRTHVLKAFADMSSWHERQPHVVITSRDTRDIRDKLGPIAEEISLNKENVAKDIERYISERLENDPALCRRWPNQRSRIKDVLTERSCGMFRWVECQLDVLAQSPIGLGAFHLEQLLSSLPESLDETYDRMLQDIPRAFRADAKKILTMLCFASRPLFGCEIIDFLAVDASRDKEHRFDPNRRIADEDSLVDFCPGFLHVTPDFHNSFPAKRFRIAHFSIQEYLVSDRLCKAHKISGFYLKDTISHGEIAKACLAYLLAIPPRESTADASIEIQIRYPLLNYAANSWVYHYAICEDSDQPALSIALEFLMDEPRLRQWWNTQSYPSYNLFPLHKSSRYDNMKPPLYLLRLSWRPGYSKSREQSALSALSALSKLSSALDVALRLNSPGLVQKLMDRIEDSTDLAQHIFPLEMVPACSIIYPFISHEMRPNHGLLDFMLSTALESGFFELSQLLINRGADIWEGVFLAVMERIYSVRSVSSPPINISAGLQLLHRLDIDPATAPDHIQQGLLIAAIWSEEIDIVRQILDKNVDITEPHELKQCPLNHAFRCNRRGRPSWKSRRVIDGIIDLLLRKLAKSENRTSCYTSNLTESVKTGKLTSVSELLEKLASDLDRSEYQSLLDEAACAAFRKGEIEIFELLLDNGIAPDPLLQQFSLIGPYGLRQSTMEEMVHLLSSRRRQSPPTLGLVVASFLGQTEYVKEILADHTDLPHDVALAWAIRRGYPGVVRELKGLTRYTDWAFAEACHTGDIEILQLFFCEDVEWPNDPGIALRFAVQENCEEAVRTLFARGVSLADGQRRSVLNIPEDLVVLEDLWIENDDPLLLMAIKRRYKNIAKLLLDHGFPIRCDYLSEACKKSQWELVELLLEAGARANHSCRSPLSSVIYNSRLSGNTSVESFKIMEKLCDAGVDINEERSDPLAMAVAYRSTEIIQYLLNRGARITYRVLMTADGDTELLKMLHSRRALQAGSEDALGTIEANLLFVQQDDSTMALEDHEHEHRIIVRPPGLIRPRGANTGVGCHRAKDRICHYGHLTHPWSPL